VLDYVAAWYVKAAEYMATTIQPPPTPDHPLPLLNQGGVRGGDGAFGSPPGLEKETLCPPPGSGGVGGGQWQQEQSGRVNISAAFVSTNSICQGEQVGILWKHLLAQGVNIHFAHRTFRWSNEGKGVAAVHCVIVGFGLSAPKTCTLFDYGGDIAGEPVRIAARRINPYLVDAPTVLLDKRRKPLWDEAPEMVYGSKPTDGGHLLLSPEEADTIRFRDPIAAKYIRPFLGADEFINNLPRYCLWLADSTAQDRKGSPEIQHRMQAVATMRLASPKAPTRKLAATPYLFGEIRQTDKPYLLVPSVSSEQRLFVPIGYLPPTVITSNANFMLPNASLTHFGLLCSTLHNAWMRTVCGRLESRYRYSNTIVYNNFPWPASLTAAHTARIEAGGPGHPGRKDRRRIPLRRAGTKMLPGNPLRPRQHAHRPAQGPHHPRQSR
jgi:hypothetical protein